MSIDDRVVSQDLPDLLARLRQGADRMARLQAITAELARAQTTERVVEIILREGLPAVQGRGGGVLQISGETLTLLGAVGYPDEVSETWRRIPLDAPVPAGAVARTGEALFLGSHEQIVEHFPLAGEQSHFAPDSAMAIVPLMLDGINLGVLALTFAQPSAFDADERSFIQALGHHCALALERVRLLDVTRQAQQRQAFLSQASTLLASSLDYSSTLQQVARLAVPTIADWCAVDILSGLDTLERLATAHVDPAKVVWARELQERYPVDLDAPSGLPQVLRTGQPMLVPTVTEEMLARNARDADELEMIRALGFSSSMIVPLTARGRTFGVISLVAAESGYHYGPDDLALARDLADRAALAIDNARLFREAQEHAARATARAEASRAMVAAGLDLQSVADTIARVSGEQLGQSVVVRLLSEDGQWLHPVSCWHPDSDTQRLLEEMVNASPLRTHEGFNAVVVATGKPLNYPSRAIPGETLQTKPEFEAYYRQLGQQCLLIVPMQVRSQLVGTLALFRERRLGLYSADEELFAQDLADVAALAVDAARLYQESQQAVRARDSFLSVASHELKTPLTTIKGLGQLLQRVASQPALDAPRIVRLTEQLRGQTDRFQELVDDLLDVSRIQQGRLALQPEPTDLSELVRQVSERFADAAERQPNHELLLVAPEPVVGHWDPARLDQVLTNLISNALKYSPDGGKVRLVVRQLDGEAELQVIDQGIGIDEDERVNLFQPFVRVDRVRTQVGGTGLGLYISKEIVEQHGGRILLESERDHGSVFSVRLPLE